LKNFSHPRFINTETDLRDLTFVFVHSFFLLNDLLLFTELSRSAKGRLRALLFDLNLLSGPRLLFLG
jgi:hypothetical protein